MSTRCLQIALLAAATIGVTPFAAGAQELEIARLAARCQAVRMNFMQDSLQDRVWRVHNTGQVLAQAIGGLTLARVGAEIARDTVRPPREGATNIPYTLPTVAYRELRQVVTAYQSAPQGHLRAALYVIVTEPMRYSQHLAGAAARMIRDDLGGGDEEVLALAARSYTEDEAWYYAIATLRPPVTRIVQQGLFARACDDLLRMAYAVRFMSAKNPRQAIQVVSSLKEISLIESLLDLPLKAELDSLRQAELHSGWH